MIKHPSVFVIIVTYKGKQWYDRCLGSLRQSTIALNVVVIDNASNDGSIEYIRDHYPEVHLIQSNENVGFGRANNIGMRYALQHECDYVFLLNQDAWVEPDTISQLVEIHKNNPQYGVFSPVHLNAAKNGFEKILVESYLVNSTIIDPYWVNDLYFDCLKEVYPIKFINAAAWLLPCSTLRIVGGFDPLFYHYGEDDNYIQRVLFHGLKVGFCPRVRIVHDHQLSINAQVIQPLYLFHKSILVESANINTNFRLPTFCHTIVYCVKSIVCKRFDSCRSYWKRYSYLKKNKEAIMRSRTKNIMKGMTWL